MCSRVQTYGKPFIGQKTQNMFNFFYLLYNIRLNFTQHIYIPTKTLCKKIEMWEKYPEMAMVHKRGRALHLMKEMYENQP